MICVLPTATRFKEICSGIMHANEALHQQVFNIPIAQIEPTLKFSAYQNWRYTRSMPLQNYSKYWDLPSACGYCVF